jgi:hypothetical protein
MDARMTWYSTLATHPCMPDTILQRFIYRAVGPSAHLGPAAAHASSMHAYTTHNAFAYGSNHQTFQPQQPHQPAAHSLPHIFSSSQVQHQVSYSTHTLGAHTVYAPDASEFMHSVKRNFTSSTALMSLLTYALKLPLRYAHKVIIDLRSGLSHHLDTLQCINQENLADNPDREPIAIRLTRNMTAFLPAYAIEGALSVPLVSLNLAIIDNHEHLKPFFQVTARDDLANWNIHRASLVPTPQVSQHVISSAVSRVLHIVSALEAQRNQTPAPSGISESVSERAKDPVVYAAVVKAAEASVVYSRNGSGWTHCADAHERRLLLDVFLRDKAVYAADSILRRTASLASQQNTAAPSQLSPDRSKLLYNIQFKVEGLLTMATNTRLLPLQTPAWQPAL